MALTALTEGVRIKSVTVYAVNDDGLGSVRVESEHAVGFTVEPLPAWTATAAPATLGTETQWNTIIGEINDSF